jgi:hypothetical protein
MSGIINKFGGKSSKSGVIDQTFGNNSYKSWTPHDKLLLNFYNAMIVASIDSVGSVAANGPTLGFSAQCGAGDLFSGQQASAPSGFTTLAGFDTQRYCTVQRDNTSTEYNWSTSPSATSSYIMTVWRRSVGNIRYYGF